MSHLLAVFLYVILARFLHFRTPELRAHSRAPYLSLGVYSHIGPPQAGPSVDSDGDQRKLRNTQLEKGKTEIKSKLGKGYLHRIPCSIETEAVRAMWCSVAGLKPCSEHGFHSLPKITQSRLLPSSHPSDWEIVPFGSL